MDMDKFQSLVLEETFLLDILFVPHFYLVLHQKGLLCWSFFKNRIVKTVQVSCCVNLIMFCTISNSYNTFCYYENTEAESMWLVLFFIERAYLLKNNT